MRTRGSRDSLVVFMILALVSVLALSSITGGCQPPEVQDRNSTRHTIVVYGFSVEEEVMTEQIFPAFQDYWREETGQEVTVKSVFASSEQLTEEILDDASADVAILSNEQHATWLRINNTVETDWRSFPQQGVISRSPLIIVVRPGNPLRIEDWADLARPGVRLVHPDPHTSGGAQWALLAEYGSALLGESNADKGGAYEQLRDIWANVVATPPSAREALKEFTFGVGDALVTYEQDGLMAQARGATLEVVMPRSTIMSEHVVVLVDRNVRPWEREVVEALITFLWSKTAQEALTRYYFRAVSDEELNQAVSEFQDIQRPFTVYDLGGWGWAYPEIIRGVWEEQIFEGID